MFDEFDGLESSLLPIYGYIIFSAEIQDNTRNKAENPQADWEVCVSLWSEIADFWLYRSRIGRAAISEEQAQCQWFDFRSE